MRKALGASCLLLGAVLLIAALLLYRNNQAEADEADQAAQSVMDALIQVIPSETVPDSNSDAQQSDDEEKFEPTEDDEGTEPEISLDYMPDVIVGGYNYIGYLSFPEVEINLPVMSQWDYAKLRIAPCRQFGSLDGDNLVIAAHNYERHFGYLHKAEVGDTVYFTDIEGHSVEYSIEKIRILKPTQVADVEESGYDLVLYTCTFDSSSRVVAFCNRVVG